MFNRGASILVVIVSTALVWISLINEPRPPAGDHLDRSWQEGFSYFFRHRFQAGQDYFFNNGPLGHFYIPGYHPDLFWIDYGFELLFKAWLTFIVVRFALSLPTRVEQLTFTGLFSIPMLILGYIPDNAYIFVMVLSVATIVGQNCSSMVRQILPLSGLIAVVGLLKFSFLILAIPVVGILGFYFAAKRKFQAMLFLMITPPIVYLALWFACGQSWRNLPIYFQSSFELAEGYLEAMASEHYWDRLYAVLAFVCVLLLVSLWLPLRRSEFATWFAIGPWSITGVMAVALALAWKHAFVRADMQHIVGFFWLLPVMLVVVRASLSNYDWKSPMRTGLMGACVALSLFGFVAMTHKHQGVSLPWGMPTNFASRVKYVFMPTVRQREADENWRTMAAQFDLPKIRTAVAKEPVDIVSYEQGVLFLNDWNWRPRPMFQGYSAYTPFLQEANAKFLRSSQAPTFIVFKLQTIDDRLPTLDDSMALREILTRYEPLFEEGSYLLLERREIPSEWSTATVREQTIRFEETYTLDESASDCQSVRLQIRLSLRGKLQKALYQIPKVKIELRMADGQVREYRIIPSMIETDVLINPLLLETQDVRDFFDASGSQRVESIRLSCFPNEGYVNEIRIVVKNFDRKSAVRR